MFPPFLNTLVPAKVPSRGSRNWLGGQGGTLIATVGFAKKVKLDLLVSQTVGTLQQGTLVFYSEDNEIWHRLLREGLGGFDTSMTGLNQLNNWREVLADEGVNVKLLIHGFLLLG